MCDVVFVHASASHGIYGDLGDELIAVEPNPWLRMIAGYVRDRGFDIAVIDQEAERLHVTEVAARIYHLNPRLVVMVAFGHQPSASTQQMTNVRAVLSQIGQNFKSIIVGGHASALPERTIKEEPCTFVCVGEGPKTITGLLWELEKEKPDYASVPGLVWRDGGQTVRSPSAPLIADLDKDLNGDVWDLLPMDRYVAHNWQCLDGHPRTPYASIYTSLGCPYKCEFCCINAPFQTNRYRTRSPASVVAEMLNLYKFYGVKTFKFADELFVLKESHYKPICEGLINAGLGDKINIWAYARVDTVQPGNLALLRHAGIRWLALGIESGNEAVRDASVKKLRNNDIVGVARQIQSAGINVIGNYIFGLPHDTYETMQQTLDLALECNTEFANFYSAMAYPGSPLYSQAVREGWALPDRWAGYSQHNYWSRPLDTKHVTGAAVLAFRDHAFQVYFNSPKYRKMVIEKFGEAGLSEIRKMTRYKLKRKLLGDVAA